MGTLANNSQGLDKQFFERKIVNFSYTPVSTYVLGAQTNCLNEFWLRNKRKIIVNPLK